MTMTGRVMADQIGDEFLPDDEAAVPWAHEFGALDAGFVNPVHEVAHERGNPLRAMSVLVHNPSVLSSPAEAFPRR